VERVESLSIKERGLSLSDFAILEVLLHKGILPVNTIGQKVLLTSGSITSALTPDEVGTLTALLKKLGHHAATLCLPAAAPAARESRHIRKRPGIHRLKELDLYRYLAGARSHTFRKICRISSSSSPVS